MKDSWLSFDHARRWWVFLLLSVTLGAVLGLAYYFKQAHPVEYAAIAQIAIEDPESEAKHPPAAVLRFDAGSWDTGEAVVEHVTSSVATMVRYTNNPAEIHHLQIERHATDDVWWKSVTLGGVIGALLAFSVMYLWKDAGAYRRTLHGSV